MLDARRVLAVHPILQPCSLCLALPGSPRVCYWLWHQCGQAGNEIQWLEDDVGRAIPVRRLELVTDVAIRCQRQPLLGHGRPCRSRNRSIRWAMVCASWVSSALVGALTLRNRAVPLGRSTYKPTTNSMWATCGIHASMHSK